MDQKRDALLYLARPSSTLKGSKRLDKVVLDDFAARTEHIPSIR